MVRSVFIFIALFLFSNIFAQFTLSGTVKDKSGEPLIGANIVIVPGQKGTISSTSGAFSFSNLTSGEYKLLVTYIGYSELEKNVSLTKDAYIDLNLEEDVIEGEEIIVRSTRAGKNTPITYTEIDKEAIQPNNMGQDMPYLFGMEPSVITTSDAGGGVGYTGLWVRGSNIQRINVTVNGVPLNDPESHSVYFVNMPDFASSMESAQIQRGVGTSTNGGGAFGATINLETNQKTEEAFAEINSAYGSFNTFKNNVQFGTGLIKDKWIFEGRLSKISSEGYVDRSSSDLKSFFLQGGYYGDNTTVKAIVFSGKEKTYQAWYGVDDWTVDNLGRTYNWAGVVYNDDGSEWYYDNQTDNYQQDHYQLHLTQKISDIFTFNLSGHYTYGRGYYEEYNQDSYLGDYPIGVQYFGFDSTMVGNSYEYYYNDSVEYGDLITRRWLDNQFYGLTFSFDYILDRIQFNLGGAINKYANARHYGEIIWAEYAGDLHYGDPYYDNTSDKEDFNAYLKVIYTPVSNLNLFLDMQGRSIAYEGHGTDNDGSEVDIDKDYFFFNPKLGLSIQIPLGMVYGSFAVANREPIRSDFLDAEEGVTPEPETLYDLELGIRKTTGSYFYSANAYFMDYRNQLVLTGEINDVGSFIRSNVGESTRMGIELDGGSTFNKWFSFRANASLSTSATDYKVEEEDGIKEYNNVQVSFSPQAVLGAELIFIPVRGGEIATTTRYISKQYLDLTQNEDLALDPYTTTNLRLTYHISPGSLDELRFNILVNNLFNAKYSSNGYVWDGVAYYYPQAGTNYLAGISLRF